MPLYEFECEKCAARVEGVFGMNAPAPTHCDLPMRKLISQTAPPQFKGAGFYVNDYKRAWRPGDDGGPKGD